MSLSSIIVNMSALWGQREDNWVITISRRLALFSITVSVILLLWRYGSLPPLVPLWYSKPWGVDRLSHPLWLTLLPIGSLMILIINTITSRILTRDMLIFSQVLAATVLLVGILSLITLTKILFLVS